MKKLIEVALPLEAINTASAREKSIRHGHPSTLHLWWSRKPLATCRAVLFASLVNDPSAQPEEFPTEKEQEAERQRLFGIIERLVQWENSNNPKILEEARTEILKHTNGKPPPVLDPFAGGGSIPLEAQRLGLESHASDLNPVAVLINKALIEIPPKFAGQPPVNPESRKHLAQGGAWKGATGLAEDVRYYGKWMREEAEKRLGHLYPKATVWVHRSIGTVYTEEEYANILANKNTLLDSKISLPPYASDLEKQELTVIAWLWARTVKCPNPACGIQMPLASRFVLSSKKGQETSVEPKLDKDTGRIKFAIRRGSGAVQGGTVQRRGAICIACDTPVILDYLRAEGQAGRMSAQLMAIVAENRRGRLYLPPTVQHELAAANVAPEWKPDTDLHGKAAVNVPLYGMKQHSDLFTERQLSVLAVLGGLVADARLKIIQDCRNLSGALSDEYSNAVATYLGLAVSRLSDSSNALCD